MIVKIENCVIKRNTLNLYIQDFYIDQQEIVSITGNIGSGKTTFLRHLAGFIKADQSEKNYFFTNDLPSIKNIGYVSHYPKLQLFNKVNDELDLSNPLIATCVETFSLSSLLSRNPWELSLGESTIIAILMNLSYNPKLILLDEIFTSLDSQYKALLADLIKKASKTTSFIITSHFVNEQLQATRYYHIKDNKLIQHKEVFKLPEININQISTSGYKQIIADKISHKLGNRELFKDLTFDINKQDLLLIKGVCGSGKTTLAKIIARLIKPRSGNIAVYGTNKNIAYLPEHPADIFVENCLEQDLKWSNKVMKKALHEQLPPSLLNLINTPFQELSYGQVLNIAIHSLLLLDPAILVLDEPFKGLDMENIIQLFNTFNKLREEGKTIVITTHYPFNDKGSKVISL